MKEKTLLLFGLAGAVILYFFNRKGTSALTGVPLTLGTTATNPMSAGLVGLETAFAGIGSGIAAAFGKAGGTVVAPAGSPAAVAAQTNANSLGFGAVSSQTPTNQSQINTLESNLENNAATDDFQVDTSDQGYSTTLSAPPATGGDDADFFFGV